MYESLAPVFLAPFVVALGLMQKTKKKIFKLDRDGRVKLNLIEKLEHYSDYPKRQLSIGLNNHLGTCCLGMLAARRYL